MNKQNIYIKKITISALIIAIYIVIMMITQPIAYNLIQVRFATSLYALSAIFPFLIIPLGLANSLGNVLGGFGLPDIIGGFFVGVITSTFIYLIGKYKLNNWFMLLPLILGPGLIVPIWLHIIINLNYFYVASFLCIGQIIPAILGVLIYQEVLKRFK